MRIIKLVSSQYLTVMTDHTKCIVLSNRIWLGHLFSPLNTVIEVDIGFRFTKTHQLKTNTLPHGQITDYLGQE